MIADLTATVQAVNSAQTATAASAASAVTAAGNALISETNVANLAQQAITTVNTAQAAAAAAGASATAASGSQTAASTSASAASTSASAASSSQTAASASQSAAATSASAALASQNAASTSASAASSSASSASGSASAGATSATNAATSASGASTSATNAAASATSASTSAATATTQAGNASTSATNAANSATSASGSATTATTQATNAANSASAAAASAASIALPIPISSGGTGQTTAAGLLAALGVGSLSGINKAINGACTVAQRPSFVASAGTSGYGGPDRYIAQNTASAGGQFTQSAGTITYGGVAKAAVVQTVSTAIALMTSTNIWQGIQQRFEGFNVFDLLGYPVALSFIFNTNVTGTYSVSVRDGTSANSYVTTFSATANTPVKVSLSVATLSTALGIPNSNAVGLFVNIGALNQATYQTATLNAWQTGNFMSASGAVNWGATAANFIAMTELQLELGASATPFAHELYESTLGKCLRYCPAITVISGGLSWEAVGWTATSATANYRYAFMVPPRTPPTGITVVNVGNFTMATNTATATPTAITFTSASLNAALVLATTSGTPFSSNAPSSLLGNAAGGQIIFNGCEL